MVITQIFERWSLVELLLNVFTGIFSKDRVNIVRQADLKELKKYMTSLKDFESNNANNLKIRDVEQHQEVMESDSSLHNIYPKVRNSGPNQSDKTGQTDFEMIKRSGVRLKDDDMRKPVLKGPQNTMLKSRNKIIMRYMKRHQEISTKGWRNIRAVTDSKKHF